MLSLKCLYASLATLRAAFRSVPLVQETRTRWNSGYDMADRFSLLADPVARVLMKLQREKSTKSKPPEMLTATELEALAEVRNLLIPLALATAEASADQTVTISKVIPLVNLMKKKIEDVMPATGIGFNLKEMLLADLRNQFGNIEFVKKYAVATLLDPRFKKLPFTNRLALADALTYLGDLVKAKIAENEDAATELEEAEAATYVEANVGVAPEDDVDLWSSLDSQVRANRTARRSRPQASGTPNELQRYLEAFNCDRRKNPNPFEVLKSLEGQYPIVCEVARDHLQIVVTSTPCERLFSHAGRIYHQLRCRLLGKRVNELVFLRSIPEEDWFDG